MNRPQPSTVRKIYRIGNPIPFPTSVDELTEQLIWALEELHRHEHESPNTNIPPEKNFLDAYNPIADSCRMRLALQDQRFLCPDGWHRKYQPGPPRGLGACPTCDHDWIAIK